MSTHQPEPDVTFLKHHVMIPVPLAIRMMACFFGTGPRAFEDPTRPQYVPVRVDGPPVAPKDPDEGKLASPDLDVTMSEGPDGWKPGGVEAKRIEALKKRAEGEPKS